MKAPELAKSISRILALDVVPGDILQSEYRDHLVDQCRR